MKRIFLILTMLGAQLSHVSMAEESNAIQSFNQKNYQAAKVQFKAHPIESEKNYYLGRIALIEKDFDRAEELLENALEKNPNNADYHFWFGRVNLLKAANASLFSAPGYASAGKKHLAKALELEPKHIDATKDSIRFYLNAPGIVGGSVKKAVAMAEELVKFAPVDGYQMLLGIYRKEENDDKELEVASLLGEKFSDNPQAMLSSGLTFQSHKAYEKALKLFEKASRLKVDDGDLTPASALYQVGRTAVLSGQFTEKGIQALELYIELEGAPSLPSKNWARYRLASLYQQKGDAKKAKALATLAGKEKSDKELAKRVKKFLRELG